MLWFYAAILSYFLFALASVADRYLLAGPLQHRRAAVFYGGITGIWVVLLIPFGFSIPTVKIIALSFLAGFLSVSFLWALYNTLKAGYVSTALPMIGALAAIFTLLFSFIFFGGGTIFTARNFYAFVPMLAGSFLLSLRKEKSSRINFLRALLAAAILGLSFVATKAVFSSEGIINGLIWIQFGAFLSALSLLFSKHTREIVFKRNPIKKKKVWGAILIQKGAGGGGFLLQKVAIWQVLVAELAFINALAGFQYIFILVIAVVLSFKHPQILKEEFTKASIIWRAAGILLIFVGLWILIR